jgi:hypothetical protein
MSFDGKFSQFKPAEGEGRGEKTLKRTFAMQVVLWFTEDPKESSVPHYDIQFLDPTDTSIRFRIKDRGQVSTLPAAYQQFLSFFQLFGEFATKDNCRLTEDEDGPYIEFQFEDIL